MRQEVWMLERMSELAQWIDVPRTEAEGQWDKIDKEISDVFEVR